jgi:hypothetical protein
LQGHFAKGDGIKSASIRYFQAINPASSCESLFAFIKSEFQDKDYLIAMLALNGVSSILRVSQQ